MADLESDDIFFDELKKGYSHQKYVNDYFIDLGFKTQIDELKIRNNRNEINDFSDNGDLFIFTKKGKLRIEVKSRNLSFTGIQDFPYDTILVDRVNTWLRKVCDKKKPHAIIIISQITKKMFVIPISSEKKWFFEEKRDTVRDYDRNYILCNKEDLKSIEEFIVWLKKIS